jgi:exosortase
MEYNNKKTFWWLIIFSLFLVAFFPALKKLANIWANSEEYSHAFLVIPIIGYMIWKKRIQLSQSTPKYRFLGLFLLVPFLVTYVFALYTEVNTLIFLSAFLSALGTIVYIFGVQSLTLLTAPLILLFVLIPIPEQLYTSLTFPLQLKVSEISEVILRLFQIPMLREGNVMQIPGMSFEVIEACSGLRSVVALVTISIIMGSFIVNSLWSKLILFSFSIPLAIIVNIIRVVSMILLYHYFRLDLTKGAWHTISGLFVFVIAIFSLFFLQYVLEHWEQKQIKNT